MNHKPIIHAKRVTAEKARYKVNPKPSRFKVDDIEGYKTAQKISSVTISPKTQMSVIEDGRFVLFGTFSIICLCFDQIRFLSMIKNQRLHTQWDNASVHEGGADVNVITFR